MIMIIIAVETMNTTALFFFVRWGGGWVLQLVMYVRELNSTQLSFIKKLTNATIIKLRHK